MKILSIALLAVASAFAAPSITQTSDFGTVYSLIQGHTIQVFGSGLGSYSTAKVSLCGTLINPKTTSTASHTDFVVPVSMSPQSSCALFVIVSGVNSNTLNRGVNAAPGAPVINSVTDKATGQIVTSIVGNGVYSLNGSNLGGYGVGASIIVAGVGVSPALGSVATRLDFVAPSTIGLGSKDIKVTVNSVASNIRTVTGVTTAPSFWSCSAGNPEVYQAGVLAGPCAGSLISEAAGSTLVLNGNAFGASCVASVSFGGAPATVTGCTYNGTSKRWELTFTTPVIGYGVTAVDVTVNSVAVPQFFVDWQQ